MNEEARRLAEVRAAIQSLVEAGTENFRPGDVASYQRDKGAPIPVWELRALFTKLVDGGVITLDEATGHFSLNANDQSVAAG